MDITFKFDNNKDEAFEVRRLVFIDEQGFVDEFDEIDEEPATIQVTVYCDGELAGCARIFASDLEPKLDTEEGTWVLGRLAVLPQFREYGLGTRIMKACEAEMSHRGASKVVLHAQCRVQPFYRKCGYEPFGPIEFEEHVEHQWMGKSL